MRFLLYLVVAQIGFLFGHVYLGGWKQAVVIMASGAIHGHVAFMASLGAELSDGKSR